jgi:poly(hydroxyalkanoate) granule-associated protein
MRLEGVNGMAHAIPNLFNTGWSNLMAIKKTIKSTKSKVTNAKARAAKVESVNLVEKGRGLWLASIGAAQIVRKKGEVLTKNLESEVKKLRKKANTLVNNLTGDVTEQAQGVLAQVKSAAAANVSWVGEKVEDTVGKVLTKAGLPTKADITELSRRVDALHKQVKSLKKAA